MDVYCVARVPAGSDPGDLFKHLVDKHYDFLVTEDVAAISKWKEGNPDISARNEMAQNEPQEIVPLPMEAIVNQVNGEVVDAVMQENDENAVADRQNGAPDDAAMGEPVAAEQPLYNRKIKMEYADGDQFENVNANLGLRHEALPPQMNQIAADFSPDGSLNDEEEVEERNHILEMMEKADDKNQAKQNEQIEKGQKKQEAKKKDTAKDLNRTWCEDCQRSVVRSYFQAHRERMHNKLEKKINQKEALAKKLEKAQKKNGKTCGDCGKTFTIAAHCANHLRAYGGKPHFHCKRCDKPFPNAVFDKHRH